LKFEPGINCIVGPSDKGKSAIFRALTWVTSNKPRGNAHIREGETSCEVRLLVDGHTISRQRTKSKNTYHLDKKEFKAFGTETPDEIKDLLKLDEVNFQSQHDAPFWLCNSPGEVAKKLNAVVDLEIIDQVLSTISSESTSAKRKLGDNNERLEASLVRVDELKNVPSLNTDLKRVEEFSQKKESLSESIEELGVSIWNYKRLDKKAKQKSEYNTGGVVVCRLGEACLETFSYCNKLAAQIEELEQLEVIKDPPSLEQLDLLVDKNLKAAMKVTEFKELLKKLSTCRKDLDDSKQELANAKVRYATVIGEDCPLCGNPITYGIHNY